MAQELRPEEKWAKRVISAELGTEVHQQDRNAGHSTYDLRIGPEDAPEVAIECTAAADQAYIQGWNAGPGRGPQFFDDIEGDWVVVLRVRADFRRVLRELPDLLRPLEVLGVCRMGWAERRAHPEVIEALEAIGVTEAYRSETRRGRVDFTYSGDGGFVDSSGTGVVAWLGEFVRQPRLARKLANLQASGAPERHLFVPVTMAGSPWEAMGYLTLSRSDQLPPAPDLPEALTGVWLAPTFLATTGLRWTGRRWKSFDLLRD